MKILRTQILFALSLVFTIGLYAFTNFEKPVNFGGTWMLDVSRSELGSAPVPKTKNSMIRIIKQLPVLIIEKSLVDSAGKVHSRVDTISFDGKVIRVDVGNGRVIERIITQSWSADQQVMTLVSKFNANNNGHPIEFTGSEIWSLADGGKTLTIVNETVLPARTEKIKLVYTKL